MKKRLYGIYVIWLALLLKTLKKNNKEFQAKVIQAVMKYSAMVILITLTQFFLSYLNAEEEEIYLKSLNDQLQVIIQDLRNDQTRFLLLSPVRHHLRIPQWKQRQSFKQEEN